MKLTIISGSQRPDSRSQCIAHYLEKLSHEHGFTDIRILSLYNIELPLHDGYTTDISAETHPWRPISRDLIKSDAFIFITPEWHGMVTPALKNFLLHCSLKELGHKPALLSSVSSGINGVYPLCELRMTGFKNNHVCFLPDHLIFRQSDNLISNDLICSDELFENRANYTLKLLKSYSSALKLVRENMGEESKKYQYGM
ncbi:NAD(P)H-dependent oxidoreductase [Xenorhabdus sp. 42]|uniref:NADPH-dependent FMN reductase n=1 Tax=Xenorhabdus szentirmaii TaxID=290112 RepID=UPI0019941404|nr:MULTISPECIES: NAD(P)H-dependent oxidoreductase [unclassified Xenorhabdus]MBD2781412.1 NAD(P)H-dependent oxidoreductase [Xenorhabdus sp. 38]MBD2791514.1 NAD(P)H-dependent oxidoreductase [Xenorhabdus sp. CUL]MBD2805281.1 NAD(P)H-dependent oxidoreductase [Xenorhabdus sp. ZM]MBD2821803.1 NAD(P)H-dependent oxidoreductase [Xenorhabdus sp. 42]MBD2824668.1 NAD(P)H-dependent oxidoreductase [Xenorhabdus sp. 5]